MENNNLEYLEEIGGELVIKGEFLTKLAELKKVKESAEKELKALSGNIVSELKTHYTDTTKVGNYNFVVKGGAYSVGFDLEQFRLENPITYIKYLKPTFTAVSSSLVSATRVKKEDK